MIISKKNLGDSTSSRDTNLMQPFFFFFIFSFNFNAYNNIEIAISNVCNRPLWVLILEFIPFEILLLSKSSGINADWFSSKVLSIIYLIIQKKNQRILILKGP